MPHRIQRYYNQSYKTTGCKFKFTHDGNSYIRTELSLHEQYNIGLASASVIPQSARTPYNENKKHGLGESSNYFITINKNISLIHKSINILMHKC